MYKGSDIGTSHMYQSILYVDGGDGSLSLTNNDAHRLVQMGLNAEPNGTAAQNVEAGLDCISDTIQTSVINHQIPGDQMELVTRFNYNKKKLQELPEELIQKISEAGLIYQDDESLQCQYCGVEIPFQDVSDRNHPFAEHCKKAPWCIHVKNHPQETLQSHMDSCPPRQLECPFKLIGCTFRGQDEAIKIHQMDHVKQMQDLTSENKKLKQENDTLRHQVEVLKCAERENKLKTKGNVDEVKFKPTYEDQQAMENLDLEERGTSGACASQELTSYASGLDEDGYKTLEVMGFPKDIVDAAIQDITRKHDYKILSVDGIIDVLLQMQERR